MPTLSVSLELSPGSRKVRPKIDQASVIINNNIMSPEQEASPPPAAPGASPSPPSTTTTRLLTSSITKNSMNSTQLRGQTNMETASSDVEQFSGKIVYNPDGSAYIIEDGTATSGNNSDNEVDNSGNSVPEVVPQLQAVYISRLLKQQQTEFPAVHSYRVVSLRDAKLPRPLTVPVKPILMCFVCKLSFGFARSFVTHAQSEHGVILTETERDILSDNCSAILQITGTDKKPIVSLLESLMPPSSIMQQLIDQQNLLKNQALELSMPSSFTHDSSSSITTTTMASSSNLLRNPLSSTLNPSPLLYNTNSSTTTTTTAVSTTSNSPSPTFTSNFLTGTTIGVCPEHLHGRPSGIECSRCELILASSRLGQVGLANVHSRNSCKTLKCPKCNWHYKYQETLEIHMKEKHPDAETSCIYCIASQPHPRLARGETYTCGYKPYRCEVCNYSTTTKGNLSIHMQSDKHLNNMQELQNGGQPNLESPKTPSHHSSPIGANSTANSNSTPINCTSKPKPSFRCDVCNYETNVARNLRIHMTSEKHTHNMLVLQQNVKHMQTLSVIHNQQQQQQQQQQPPPPPPSPSQIESLFSDRNNIYANLMADKPEAALADMAYNQALLIQMMTGGQIPGHVDLNSSHHSADLGLNPDAMEPPPDPADLDPEQIYHCCVCNNFDTDSLDELGRHLSLDRTRLREQEILTLVAGHYVCNLCTYKTNLKANFQLHCKTDKHLQRLQHVNHIKEGGPRNEWKLKFATASSACSGGVQIRCNACDYYTNSAHKLQLHSSSGRHDAGTTLLRHLCDKHHEMLSSGSFNQSKVAYHCLLCNYTTHNRLPLLQHIRSLKHVNIEQIHQLQRKAEGKDTSLKIGDVFHVSFQQKSSESTPVSIKSECDTLPLNLETVREIDNIKSEMPEDIRGDSNRSPSQHSRLLGQNLSHFQKDNDQQQRHQCPLCQQSFNDRSSLEKHVMQIHSVNVEGLQCLLMLVDHRQWLSHKNTPNRSETSNPPNTSTTPTDLSMIKSDLLDTKINTAHISSDSGTLEAAPSPHFHNSDDNETSFDSETSEKCNTCSKSFKNIDELCLHQNETGHLELKETPSGPGYYCWKKGCNQFFQHATALQCHFRDFHAKNSITQMSVSEKHVYKYRCNQCSLAFKTVEKLQLHSQYHLIRDSTKCVLCGRSFRSILALHKHVENFHSELTDDELNAYKQSLMKNPLLLAGLQGHILDSSTTTNDILRNKQQANHESNDDDLDDTLDETSSLPMSDEEANDLSSNNLAQNVSLNLSKEQQFVEDYLNSQALAEDNYNDPNRKYKCHRCKVAFTRQNYLTAHNKTLLHRKGEKLTYPMEKFLDPNRPYKCDVCRESFTQKNILLVHYNSVSHLHKLKRTLQDQQLTSVTTAKINNINNNNNNSNNNNNNNSITDDDDKKKYRCNICKVAYSQGSTLDIHMRSVLHQTRASKLPDLAASGQIDLSRPLIEQPQSPKSTSSSASSSSQNCDLVSSSSVSVSANRSLSITTSTNTTSTATASTSIDNKTITLPATSPSSGSIMNNSIMTNTSNQGMVICTKCGSMCASQDQLSVHQQLYCMFNPGSNAASMMAIYQEQQQQQQQHQQQYQQQQQHPIGQDQSPLLETPSDFDSFFNNNKFSLVKKTSSPIYKHLLEGFGFDLVMQYNENHQRRPLQHSDQQTSADDELDNNHLPELSKSTCQHCNKEFSSIWVLKSHCEEVHKDVVPHQFLEKYADNYKSEYDKKSSLNNSSMVNTTTTDSLVTGLESSDETVQPSSDTSSTSRNSSSPNLKTEIDPKSNPVSPNNNHTNHNSSNVPVTTASLTDSQAANNMAANLQAIFAQNIAAAAAVAAQNPLALAEMQAAISMLQFQQLGSMNPMLLQMMNMGLPMNYNALSAMNLQPPLVPMMMHPSSFGQLSNPANSTNTTNSNSATPEPILPNNAAAALLAVKQQAAMIQQQQQQQQQQAAILQQQHQQQQQVAAASGVNQKRARTRITDDQLKVLRAHFDINNSPSEEQILEMASQSGLQPKVIKHWFRNNLFKERQRNKDNPYNFNIPPSTTLNLEEYEKTGEAKVMPLSSAPILEHTDNNVPGNLKKEVIDQELVLPSDILPVMKTEPKKDVSSEEQTNKFLSDNSSFLDEKNNIFNLSAFNLLQHQQQQLVTKNPSVLADVSRSNTPLNAIMTPHISNNEPVPMVNKLQQPLTSPMLPPSKLLIPQNPFNTTTNTNNNLPPQQQRMRSLSPQSNSNNRNDFLMMTANNSNSSGGSGKRANRTRFTDGQIKVLQEFFENNAYPKDDDLEYLSKLLNLSPRVIVVWFQNARQKARKVYENQEPTVPVPTSVIPPSVSTCSNIDETNSTTNKLQKTAGLSYQCRKCKLVFQRYYELIRHQKTQCYKEEDARRSAQAQAAAAQVAAVLSSEDSNSSVNNNIEPQHQHQQQHQQEPQQQISPAQSRSNMTPSPSPSSSQSPQNNDSKEFPFVCDKCDIGFLQFDLWKEHQVVHLMNPNLFFNLNPAIATSQPETQPQSQSNAADLSTNKLNVKLDANPVLPQPQHSKNIPSQLSNAFFSMFNNNPQLKRKLEDYSDILSDNDDQSQPKDKRLRTTILPEQLECLYQSYQLESNPSRKMLENIANRVGLKKRVVQVWFQNTRARERKGQFRAHSQVINKRCPFCPALFKVKSALETHLVTKHSDQCANGEINIDAIPDEEFSLESDANMFTEKLSHLNPALIPALLAHLNSAANSNDMDVNVKRVYEDAFKKIINEQQGNNNNTLTNSGINCNDKESGESPLDLSKPMRISLMDSMNNSYIDYTDDQSGDSLSDNEFIDDDSGPISPASSTQSNNNINLNSSFSFGGGGGGGSGGGLNNINGGGGSNYISNNNNGAVQIGCTKRYRTQMSSLQVRVMKILFNDYKTPTMSECEFLGREIGLSKRVIQVWFQNARAKDKKSTKTKHDDIISTKQQPMVPDLCKYCSFKYLNNLQIQEHIFTKSHIENVRLSIENHIGDHGGENAGFSTGGSISDGDISVSVSVPVSVSVSMPNSSSNNQSILEVPSNNNSVPHQMQLLQQIAAMAATTNRNGQMLKFSNNNNINNHSNSNSDHLLHNLCAFNSPTTVPNANQNISNISTNHEHSKGLFLDTNGPSRKNDVSGLTFVSMPASVLEEITNRSNEFGMTTITLPKSTNENEVIEKILDENSKQFEIEACFVCKRCKIGYLNEQALLSHQNNYCIFDNNKDSQYGGHLHGFRIMRYGYQCRLCNQQFNNRNYFKQHISQDHRNFVRGSSDSYNDCPLTSEMENVVNQITMLAAATQPESTVFDSNLNETIAKRHFVATTNNNMSLTATATTTSTASL